MTGHSCAQCRAHYTSPADSCESRFDSLLALDHSRQEPWGSRHGSAFAAFVLQHPAGRSREMLERCWTLLYRIWIAGEDSRAVAHALRRIEDGYLEPSKRAAPSGEHAYHSVVPRYDRGPGRLRGRFLPATARGLVSSDAPGAWRAPGPSIASRFRQTRCLALTVQGLSF